MKCCLQQMEVCKFFLYFRARITASGSVSETKEQKDGVIIGTGKSQRKGSHFHAQKEVPPLRSGSHPSSCSVMLCPQHPLSFLFFLLPSCPFISSLSLSPPSFLSASPPSPLTSFPAPFFPFPHPSPSSDDVELGLQRSDLIELMAL